jgi:hypothetical protein
MVPLVPANAAVPVDGQVKSKTILSPDAMAPEITKLMAAPLAGVPATTVDGGVRVPVVPEIPGADPTEAETVVGVAAFATPAPTIDRPPNRVTPVRAATPHRRIDGNLFIGPPWAFCPEKFRGSITVTMHLLTKHLLLLPREHG